MTSRAKMTQHWLHLFRFPMIVDTLETEAAIAHESSKQPELDANPQDVAVEPLDALAPSHAEDVAAEIDSAMNAWLSEMPTSNDVGPDLSAVVEPVPMAKPTGEEIPPSEAFCGRKA